jgi:hypothetical protein
MLKDIFLLQQYNGVSAGQYTQVSEEIAEKLIAEGIAKSDTAKQNKTETKKGK